MADDVAEETGSVTLNAHQQGWIQDSTKEGSFIINVREIFKPRPLLR